MSLTHCQFASVKFILIFKYGFAKGGYIKKDEKCAIRTYCSFKILKERRAVLNASSSQLKNSLFVVRYMATQIWLFYLLLPNEQHVKNWISSTHVSVRTINKRISYLFLWWYLIFNKRNLKLSSRSLLKLYQYDR